MERINRQYGDQLSPLTRRVAKAYSLASSAYRNEGKAATGIVLREYMKSLAWYPLHGASWRGILRVLMPQLLLDGYRSLRNIIHKASIKAQRR